VSQGLPQTQARRIIVVTATSQYAGFPLAGPGPGGPFADAGTDSAVTLQAGGPGRLLLHYRLPVTPQGDLKRARANFYLTSIPGPFSRADVGEGSSVLSIDGPDWWVPVYVAVFGLNTAGGQPTALIPFVHAPTLSLLQMSTDPAEGWESNRLPMAQVLTPGLELTIDLGDVLGVLAARGHTADGDRRPGPAVPVVRIADQRE
jgi:hypothetical protein